MVSPAAGTAAALPDRWLTDWRRSPRMPFYTRANAGEVLPDPASPLGWTLVFEQGLLPGWLRGMVEFGIYREGELPMDRPQVAGLFGGYFYINLSHCRVVAIRMGMTVEAFDAAQDDVPTLFIAWTIKGFGLPFAGHKDNHAGLMNPEQMAIFQQRMGVPPGAEWDRFSGLDMPAEQLEAFLAQVPLANS